MADAQTILQILLTAKDEAGPVLKGAAAAGVAAIGLIGGAALGIGNDVSNATNELQTQLGIQKDAAKELGEVAKAVYKDNFAGSVQDAAKVIAEAYKTIGDVGDEQLQSVAENALRLQDAFGIETTESIDAAKTLMEQFGLTSEQAFDFIAAGQQRGLNRSGDFLDTIGEYSVQFQNAGANADQFFAFLESGLQGGVLGTDKAADALKEYQVRIKDGSKTTKEAMEAIGLGDLLADIEAGTVTVADSFGDVIDALNQVDDPAQRMQAGVALLGTQYEDLGEKAALSLSMSTRGFQETTGAASTLDAQYNNLGSTIEGYKRQALLAIAPVSEKIGAAIPIVGQLGMSFTGLMPAVAAVKPAILAMSSGAIPAIQAMGMALLTPPVGIIVVLVAAAVAIYLFRDQIMDALGAAADFIVDKATDIKNFLLGAFESVLGFARSNWPEIATLLSGPFFPLVALATDAFGVRSALEDAMNAVIDFLYGLGDRFYRAGKNMASQLLKGLGDISVAGISINDVGGAIKKLPGFDDGGIVPGRIGEPRLVVAHGGETILPTHKSGGGGGGITVNIDKVYARDEGEARRAGGDIGFALQRTGYAA